ncbi:LysR family transcriptional regulator [Martelella sp. AD-3]|uniref:LysR family transcriptional regulator n=1 Tax=Martelella sp. AD-3 TaxID=686597 RepID=UPI00046580F1|nr:LysR family transcriptional regulator [Martelella sp. AD-3]AMM83740.1 LysR family transcriptional regulator [Martelella sp. AD-3]MAM13147.1 LysR family transcriptional regulator [Rhizobiaceae bacterium]
MEKTSWDHYRTLLAVLDTGTLSGAARRLGLTQPTVGRHIEALEAEAGQQLFTRSQRGLEPTDTARAMRHLAEAMAASADAIRRTASESRSAVAGAVRISASDVIAIEVLPEILAPLMEAHPALDIEVSVSDAVEDLLARKADIALRMVEPKQEALLVRHIGTIPIGCFARKEVIERHGAPGTLEEVEKLPTIGFDHELVYIREALDAFGDLKMPAFDFRSDSNLAQLAAIRAGCGFGFCQAPIGRRDPRLEEVLAGQVPLSLPLWVVMHEDLRRSPRCRVTFDALVTGLKAYIG